MSQQKNHKKLKITLFIITIVLIISSLVYVEFHFLFLTPFSRKMIENRFGISVSNGISLKRYKEKPNIDGSEFSLEIENISDYEKFMEENVHGKITDQYLTNDNNIIYEYHLKEKGGYEWVGITFYETDNGYKAKVDIVP